MNHPMMTRRGRKVWLWQNARRRNTAVASVIGAGVVAMVSMAALSGPSPSVMLPSAGMFGGTPGQSASAMPSAPQATEAQEAAVAAMTSALAGEVMEPATDQARADWAGLRGRIIGEASILIDGDSYSMVQVPIELAPKVEGDDAVTTLATVSVSLDEGWVVTQVVLSA